MQHAINWFEIPVADLTRAMRFYQILTGTALRREVMGAPGEELAIFEVDDDNGISGALCLAPILSPQRKALWCI